MGVRVVRTFTRFPASPDADAVKPGLDIAPCPHPSPGVFSFALDGVISAPRISRPVDCETVAHQPFAQIDIADRASCHCPPILVQRDGDAVQRPSRNKSVEIVRRLGPAPILETILASAKLTAFRRVDTPEPDAGAVNLQRVAIDDAVLIIRSRY